MAKPDWWKARRSGAASARDLALVETRTAVGPRTSPVWPRRLSQRSSGGISGSPDSAGPFAIPSGLILFMRTQPVFDSWDCTPPILPPRSRLYAIEPMGIGTPFVESLSGYVSRLADAHAVSVGNLVVRELSALVSTPLFQSSQPDRFPPRFYAINGLGEPAKKWVEALQVGTLRGTSASLLSYPLKTFCGSLPFFAVAVPGAARAMKTIAPVESPCMNVYYGLCGRLRSAPNTGGHWKTFASTALSSQSPLRSTPGPGTASDARHGWAATTLRVTHQTSSNIIPMRSFGTPMRLAHYFVPPRSRLNFAEKHLYGESPSLRRLHRRRQQKRLCGCRQGARRNGEDPVGWKLSTLDLHTASDLLPFRDSRDDLF